MLTEKEMKVKYRSILPHLDERQRRLVAASDVLHLGCGGVSLVARASGLTRPTLYRGIEELGDGVELDGRVRCAGGGRKRVTDQQPSVEKRLHRLVEPTTRGDPESPLRWTCKSTRQWRKQRLSDSFMEDGVAAHGRRDGGGHLGESFSAGNQQVEQD